jgi:predicted transport protein
MPLFEISEGKLVPVEQENFAIERDLQTLIEQNLAAVFNCRFVASEFSTGALHAGRIDSLALSEDNNPVIIEYKKVESSELINQSLFYLHWVQDHKGDFEIAVQRSLGNGVEVDWSDIRVICIAPNYKKYDLHAVQVMGANIELWKYRLFKNGSIYLEKVFQATKVSALPSSMDLKKNPVMVEAGKKAAQVRATATYEFDEHLDGKSANIQSLMHNIREFIIGLDPAVEEVPKKFYIAYKISQNIVCMEPQNRNIKLFVKLNATDIVSPPKFYRDVTEIGHYGTGDTEFTVSSGQDFELVKPYIETAYNKVGG